MEMKFSFTILPDEPDFTTRPEQVLTLNYNGKVRLVCKADGDPAPNITWSRGNVILGHENDLALTSQQSEPGVYTCTASNGIGANKTTTTNVVVNGKIITLLLLRISWW